MKRANLSLPEIALIAGTRGALGAGIALLLGDRLSAEQRKSVGWTLFGVGVATTLPIVAQILWSAHQAEDSDDGHPTARSARRFFQEH